MRIKRTILPREQHESYIGPNRSLSIIKETGDVFIHDGTTPGGFPATGIPPYPVNMSPDVVYGIRDGKWVAISAKLVVRDTGPGPQHLLHGDDDLGYYGIVTQEEMVNWYGLLLATGFNEGVDYTDIGFIEWFKFAHKGKILFVSKRPLKRSISWASLYNAGLVYGTNDDGLFPTSTPTNQLKIVEYDKWAFKIRLLTGASEDPSASVPSASPTETSDSEWDQLMYHVCATVPPDQIYDNWENFTESELGLTGVGGYNLTQNTTLANLNNRIVRGTGLAQLRHLALSSSITNTGWRPVLELIDSGEYVFDISGFNYQANVISDVGNIDFETLGFILLHADVNFNTTEDITAVSFIDIESDGLYLLDQIKAGTTEGHSAVGDVNIEIIGE